MRLSRRKKTVREIDLNIAAMIDVILLLLIFFMCTHTFNEPEKNLQSQAIANGSSKSITLEDFEPIEIIVEKIGEDIVFSCDSNKCFTLEDMKATLTRLYKIADAKVIIRAQENIPFQNMVDALNTCTKIGFTNVGFSTGALQ